MDRWWDRDRALLRYPSRDATERNPYQRPGAHGVRESALYAVALLHRDAAGDRERAERALDAVLAHQVEAPGSVCHGTWRRAPGEPVPGERPREWIDYDPNYREFVGIALLLALEREASLPPGCVAAAEGALRGAAEGTLAREVPAAYTNIAILRAFFLAAVGARLGEHSWQRAGEEAAEAVAADYRRVGAFPEHNSPTYAGIDLEGLVLWRTRAPSAAQRALGAELEATLWRDVARFYHAGLRNLCGPWTRAYGMDMNGYVAGLGAWIAAVEPEAPAPLPALGDAVPHAHDYCHVPVIALLGAQAPADVRPHLRAFVGERRVLQPIRDAPPRRASAWLAEQVMAGGEHTGGRHVHWQHHPATLHWRRSDGGVGWIRLVTAAPVDAEAAQGRLAVTVHTGQAWLRSAEVAVTLELAAGPGAPAPALRDGARWQLPGLALRVATDAPVPGEVAPGAAPDSWRVGWRFAPGTAPRQLHLTLAVDTLPVV